MGRKAENNKGKKFCGQCGTRNDNSARYCMKCGAEISYMADISSQKSKYKVLVIVGILIVVVFASVIGLLWINSKGDKLHQSATATFGYVYDDNVYYLEDVFPYKKRIVMFDKQGNKETIYSETHDSLLGGETYEKEALWGQGNNIFWEEAQILSENESEEHSAEYRIMKINLENREITQILSCKERMKISGLIGDNLYYTILDYTITDAPKQELWVYDLSEKSRRKIAESDNPDPFGARFYVFDQNTCVVSKNENDMSTTYAVNLKTGEFNKLEECEPVPNLIYENGVIYSNIRDSEKIISIDFSNGKRNEYDVEGNIMNVSGEYMLIDRNNEMFRYNMKNGACYELELNDEEIEKNRNNPDYVSGWLAQSTFNIIDTDIIEYVHFKTDYSDTGKRNYFIDNSTGAIYKFQGSEFDYMDKIFIDGEYMFYNTTIFIAETTSKRLFLDDYIAEEKWEKVNCEW